MSDGRKRSSSEIVSEIEATRAKLANDIDAARIKLSRRGLQDEAMDRFSSVRSRATGAISGVSHAADDQASHFGRLAVDTIKRYPIVSTLVGLGLAMLAFSNGSRSGSNPRTVDEDMEMVTKPSRAAADLPPTSY